MSKTDYYVLFVKNPGGKGFSKVFSNRRLLSAHLNMSYNTLTNWFVRQGKTWVEIEEGTYIIKAFDLERTRHKVKKVDPGDYRRV
jgi:hypothetical protein